MKFLVEILRHISRFFRFVLPVPFWMIHCRLNRLQWKKGWTFRGKPLLRIRPDSKVEIGERVWMVSSQKYNLFGISQPVIISTLGVGAVITIGDDVGMSGCTVAAKERIDIGSRVLIGTGVIIADTDAHTIEPEGRRYDLSGGASKPIIIEDDVFIGARAIILKGVTIGKGSIVGAGAVVSRSIPQMSIAAGNPARVVGRVDGRRDASQFNL